MRLTRRFLWQPNAANDEDDCRSQKTTMALMRTVGHHYFDKEFRNSPFILMPTDLNQHNIFVDDLCIPIYLIDLEFMCFLPMQMSVAPYWLTERSSDGITGENLHAVVKCLDVCSAQLKMLLRDEFFTLEPSTVLVLSAITCVTGILGQGTFDPQAYMYELETVIKDLLGQDYQQNICVVSKSEIFQLVQKNLREIQ
jgi:hypothetical protein